jgi:hypothetical protein
VFLRRSKDNDDRANDQISVEQVFHGLRSRILELDPAKAGLDRFTGDRRVWGALMEMGRTNGTATLVALADGTTSLYTSTGGGVIGAGAHAHVTAATKLFLAGVEDHLSLLTPDTDSGVPVAGHVIIRALTYQGRYRVEGPEDELGHNRHLGSAAFRAGHGVLTELRLLDQEKRRTRG